MVKKTKKKKPLKKSVAPIAKKSTTIERNILLEYYNTYFAKAEELIKQKPREFMIGFAALFLLLVITVFGATQCASRASTTAQPAVSSEQTEATAEQTEETQYYVVKQGESLSSIAEKLYGDKKLYTKLLELNTIDNPDIIEEGVKLRIK